MASFKKWLEKIKDQPRVHEWFAKQRQFFGSVPKPLDPNKLAKGKKLFVDGAEEPVLVKTVTGNLANPKNYEINGTHTVSILDFYTQINESRRPTADEIADWDSLELLQIDVPNPKSPKDNQ